MPDERKDLRWLLQQSRTEALERLDDELKSRDSSARSATQRQGGTHFRELCMSSRSSSSLSSSSQRKNRSA